jgi:DNA-directed RNA polymerase specialized sigma24 family protein
VDELPDVSDEVLRAWRQKIKRCVERLLPSRYDTEGVVQDVLIECWNSKREPTLRLIRWRCLDLVRRCRGDQTIDSLWERQSKSQVVPDEDVGKLIDDSQIDGEAKELLWLIFWKGLTYEEASRELKVSSFEISRRLRVTLEKIRTVSILRKEADGRV